MPASVLSAVAWVESNWRQFYPSGRPVVSSDFGYGIMQVTSGMAGAFDDPRGSIDPTLQSRIATDYRFNIAYGTRILWSKWDATPRIGGGDPAVIENWYYALWAYNGWGWMNNPNNPRFDRQGNPGSNPSGFPYQERVLWLVAHPPHDPEGNELWPAVPVTLPTPKQIGSSPGTFQPRKTHSQSPPEADAVYEFGAPLSSSPGETQILNVHLINTGSAPWPDSGPQAVTLTYHLIAGDSTSWLKVSPFTPGVLAFGQGATALPHTVLPGRRVTVQLAVAAPVSPGAYRVIPDLQEGQGTYFSELGVLLRARPFRVSATVSPTDTPTPAATPEPSNPEGMLYIADTSFPDGSTVHPRERFAKGWLIVNNGQVPWSPDWHLQLSSGKAFGAARIPLPVTQPCATLNLFASLVAPARHGTYKSVWRLHGPGGEVVGDPLTLVVTVAGQSVSPTPPPIPRTTPTPPSVPPLH